MYQVMITRGIAIRLGLTWPPTLRLHQLQFCCMANHLYCCDGGESTHGAFWQVIDVAASRRRIMLLVTRPRFVLRID